MNIFWSCYSIACRECSNQHIPLAFHHNCNGAAWGTLHSSSWVPRVLPSFYGAENLPATWTEPRSRRTHQHDHHGASSRHIYASWKLSCYFQLRRSLPQQHQGMYASIWTSTGPNPADILLKRRGCLRVRKGSIRNSEPRCKLHMLISRMLPKATPLHAYGIFAHMR